MLSASASLREVGAPNVRLAVKREKHIASVADDNPLHTICCGSGHVCQVLNRKAPRSSQSKQKEASLATVQQNDKPRRGMLV